MPIDRRDGQLRWKAFFFGIVTAGFPFLGFLEAVDTYIHRNLHGFLRGFVPDFLTVVFPPNLHLLYGFRGGVCGLFGHWRQRICGPAWRATERWSDRKCERQELRDNRFKHRCFHPKRRSTYDSKKLRQPQTQASGRLRKGGCGVAVTCFRRTRDQIRRELNRRWISVYKNSHAAWWGWGPPNPLTRAEDPCRNAIAVGLFVTRRSAGL